MFARVGVVHEKHVLRMVPDRASLHTKGARYLEDGKKSKLLHSHPKRWKETETAGWGKELKLEAANFIVQGFWFRFI